MMLSPKSIPTIRKLRHSIGTFVGTACTVLFTALPIFFLWVARWSEMHPRFVSRNLHTFLTLVIAIAGIFMLWLATSAVLLVWSRTNSLGMLGNAYLTENLTYASTKLAEYATFPPA